MSEQPKDPLDGVPPEVRDKVEQLASIMGQSFVRSLILRGQLVPEEHTEAEIRNILLAALRDIVMGQAELEVIRDWRGSLAEWAKAARDKGALEVAAILYATWIEHTVNLIVSASASRLPLTDRQVEDLLKSVPLQAKLDWLPVVFDLPAFDPDHRKAIAGLSAVRNSLVHYKWKPSAFDEPPRHAEVLLSLLERIDSTMTYLDQYIDGNLVAYDEDHLS